MSDAALVAAELQDLATTVEQVAEAIREAGRRPIDVQLPAPVLNVTVPDQPAPVVNVSTPQAAPAQVTVQASPVNVQVPVNIERAEPLAYEVTITERDVNGMISRFVIFPINA